MVCRVPARFFFWLAWEELLGTLLPHPELVTFAILLLDSACVRTTTSDTHRVLAIQLSQAGAARQTSHHLRSAPGPLSHESCSVNFARAINTHEFLEFAMLKGPIIVQFSFVTPARITDKRLELTQIYHYSQ